MALAEVVNQYGQLMCFISRFEDTLTDGRSMRVLFAVAIAAIMMSTPQVNASQKLIVKESKLGMPVVTIEPYSKSEFKKELKRAREYAESQSKKRRGVASRVNEEAALSCGFRELRDRLIGGSGCVSGKAGAKKSAVESADQLAAIIADADNDSFYSKLEDDDAKLLAAQLALLAPMRGILYRSRGLVEDYRLSHSVVLTAIRAAATGVTIFGTNSSWKSAIKFLGDPYPGIERTLQLKDDQSFYQFISTELENSVRKFHDRINELDFNSGIRFDAKTLFGETDFADDQDRYFSLGYPEQRALIGGAQLALSGIQAGKSYVWKGFFAAIQNVAEVYGYDANGVSRVLGFRSPKGATPENRVAVIRKKSPELGNFRSGHEEYLRSSYNLLKVGIQNLQAAKEATDGNTERLDRIGVRQFIDPRAVAPFGRIADTSFENLLSLLDDKPVTSAIYQGEEVRVKVREMFGFESGVTPPNLQGFLPDQFNQEKFETKKGGYIYHNYLSGAPTHWNYNYYRRYFPLNAGESELNEEGV
ncbi:MAG: hypothetical protein KDD25_07960, partial [Bdellovibrionales bacterium]|nr:hypothetical protein [Bdellovibrionales bacterium]